MCYQPTEDCARCKVADHCLFYASYENPYAKKGKGSPPRPIILVPPFLGKPLEFREGTEMDVKLLLLGEHSRYLPVVLLALQQFGGYGLGNMRHVGLNRFKLLEARCEFSGRKVYEEGIMYPSHVEKRDILELPPFRERKVRINFRTPIQLPLGFPPSPEHLLKLIRSRLVMLVNEYGSGEKVPEFNCKGEVSLLSKHHHRLVGHSERAGRREFWHCWTGEAEYTFEEIDQTGEWLLGVGKVLGAGAKSSFGMGFFDLLHPQGF